MDWLRDLANANWILAAVLFVLLRATAIVVPPIPGALLDIPAVQIFGWAWAFVLSEMGTMLGALIAFTLGRTLRITKLGLWVGKLLRIEVIKEWEKRLSAEDRFLGWVALRLPTNAAFDYISYAAGLTNCSVAMFFWSTLIGNIPVVFSFFVVAGVGFHYGNVIGWLLPLIFIGFFSIPVAFRLKKRLEKA